MGLALDAGLFTGISRRMTLLTRIRGASRLPQTSTFENELIRIGGNNYVRGFDDEAFLATSLAVFTAEWRYLLGLNSYFQVFSEVAYVLNGASVLPAEAVWPIGVGTGMAFETKAGIFALNYAVGRLLGQPEGFRLRNAKIHLGYLNFF
jgi:hemolysin activation/secretion protein